MNTTKMMTYAIGVGAAGMKALEIVKAKELPEMQVLNLPIQQNTDQALQSKSASADFEPSLLNSDGNALLYVVQLQDIPALLDMLNSSDGIRFEAFQTAIVIIPEHFDRHVLNEMLQPLIQKINSVVLVTEPAVASASNLSVPDSLREILVSLYSIINDKNQEVNVDFDDLKFVLSSSQLACVGVAEAAGQNRATEVLQKALLLPFFSPDLKPQNRVLMNISSGEEADLSMEELTEITEQLQEYFGDDTELIFGHGTDNLLKDRIRLEIVAPVEPVEFTV